MDCYIVRIYRRTEHDPRQIVGTVEDVDKEESKTFRHIDDLVKVFCFPDISSIEPDMDPQPTENG